MAIITVLGSIILGVSLAASCGLRAFLPLFVVGMGARFGLVDLGEAFVWLSSTPALLALAVGVGCELLGDKVPFVNHLLDLLATPVRTAAGMLVCAAALVDLPVWVVALLAIILGGGVALAVHVTKSGLRATSTAATAGASTPVHSLLEDAVCFAASVLSVVFWLIAVVVAVAGVALFGFSARAVYQRLTRA
ncbi:MAG: DUF4126 domain-containing protein [Deltaproteobacteria bacterium]|nr:DUF4126 domain-containing protein [Deltaproteobacteria bacterium]